MRLFIAEVHRPDYTHGIIILVAESEAQIEQVLRDSGLFYMDDDADMLLGDCVDHGEISGGARVLTWRWGGS